MDITGQTRIDEVFRRAEEILKDQAQAWLNTPILALGGKVPLEMIDTDEGTDQVLTILGRIEWGVYS